MNNGDSPMAGYISMAHPIGWRWYAGLV